MKQVRVLLITALLTAVFCTGCKNTAKGGTKKEGGETGPGITGIKADRPTLPQNFAVTNITPDSFFETITAVTFGGADGTAVSSKLIITKPNQYCIDKKEKKIWMQEPKNSTVIGFKNGDKDLGSFKYNEGSRTFTKQ